MQPTDPSKFTEKAWEAVVKSQDVARRLRHQQLEVEHVILAMLEQDGSATQSILNKAGIDPTRFKQQFETFAQRQPRVASDGQLYLGQGLDLLLDKADVARTTLQDDFISVEHLLLALTEDDRIGRRIFRSFEIDSRLLENAVKAVRGNQKVKDQNPESSYQALEKYGRDLTEAARQGKLDPVIGRDEEIRRVVQVLSRRMKITRY